jgi:alpha-L-rhamnosidase
MALAVASLALAVAPAGHAADGSPTITVTALRCEYAIDPLGVDTPSPRLFWQIAASRRAERQTAYQVLVGSSLTMLARDDADLWDSGRVESDDTIQVPYAGRPLSSSQQVFWKVRAWDREGRPSPWSAPATWTMGVLAGEDWRGARWIRDRADSETVLLRRTVRVRTGLRRALVHVSGLGQYELHVNGTRAGEDELAPGWTKYDRTCLYDTHDVTSLFRDGENALGLFLGNGMYRVHAGRYTKFTGSFGPLMAILQLRLEYSDGTTDTVVSNGDWRTHAGPITFSSIYGGEDFDARLLQEGWDRSGFDETGWQPAGIAAGPGGVLKGLTSAAPPIRLFESLRLRAISRAGPRAIYDTGQNVSLVIAATVHGPRGARIRITPAELLTPDGALDRESAGGGDVHWEYTLAGRGSETWRSHFFYHGSRFLQVDRLPASSGGELPEIDTLDARVLHSASPPIGRFESSSGLFNRIRDLVLWAQRSNMVSVLTDCPHRERLGWLEQYHLNGRSLRYGFDLAQLFRKGMSDMSDSQLPNGLVPDIAPEYTVFEKGFRDSPEWGSAYLLAAWQQYEWTGDLDLLTRHYDGMARYVAYLGSRADAYIVSHGLGDWYDIGPDRPGVAQLTPVALTATAFYFHDATILARVAGLLGRHDDAARYRALADSIRSAFNARFFDPGRHSYATGSQVSNAIPLVMGLVDDTERAAVLDAVVADVRRRGNALTAGDVGYRYLLRALAEGGRSDVIFDINSQSTKPGYGFQLARGATSLTEAWDADRRSSQNHFMLGQIMEWFYHDLAGIGGEPGSAAFKRVVIAPQPVGDLTWVKARVDTLRGTIASEWSIQNGTFTLNVTIPANTTASVSVPARSPDEVTIDGTAEPSNPEVAVQKRQSGRVTYAVPSGTYAFSVRFVG